MLVYKYSWQWTCFLEAEGEKIQSKQMYLKLNKTSYVFIWTFCFLWCLLCSGCFFPCFSDQSLYAVKAVTPEHYPRTEQILRNSVLEYFSSGITDSALNLPPPAMLSAPPKLCQMDMRTGSEERPGTCSYSVFSRLKVYLRHIRKAILKKWSWDFHRHDPPCKISWVSKSTRNWVLSNLLVKFAVSPRQFIPLAFPIHHLNLAMPFIFSSLH